jgi:hypothetical protein
MHTHTSRNLERPQGVSTKQLAMLCEPQCVHLECLLCLQNNLCFVTLQSKNILSGLGADWGQNNPFPVKQHTVQSCFSVSINPAVPATMPGYCVSADTASSAHSHTTYHALLCIHCVPMKAVKQHTVEACISVSITPAVPAAMPGHCASADTVLCAHSHCHGVMLYFSSIVFP